VGKLLKIEIPYNKEQLSIEIAKEKVIGVIEPNDVVVSGTAGAMVLEALDSVNGSETFQEFLDAPGKLLVIVNDGTRPTPTRFVLDVIADTLEAANAEFIIATGVHRGPTREEYDFIFGKHYDRFSGKVHVHDARNKEEMVYLGCSSNGTDMAINRLGVEFEKLLVIGSVEPHYFAGYTGGRKGILPGIAAYRTIEQNHKHALHPDARALVLTGNPVHEDMMDALKILKNRIFGIMTVLEKNHKIYGVTAGDIHTSFYAAIEKAKQVFVAEVESSADIVVSVSRYPMDVDLYQAQKAIDNGKLVLKDGGILILVAACREGLGEEAFVNLLSSSTSPSKVMETIKGKYILGYHKAGKMAEVFERAEVWAMTDLPDDDLRKIFIKPVKDLQNALETALAEKGPDAGVIFLMDGSVTVPSVKKQNTN
jgi:nickel-dependent lactate racemase